MQANGNSGPEEVTVNFTGVDNMQIALYYLGEAGNGTFSSGLYFYVIEAKGNDGSLFTSTKKMILLK